MLRIPKFSFHGSAWNLYFQTPTPIYSCWVIKIGCLLLLAWTIRESVVSMNQPVSDFLIALIIFSAGLVPQLVIYIAFRVGRRLRILNENNVQDLVYDFIFDNLKDLICTHLEELLTYQGIVLPEGLTIQDGVIHLHNDVENIDILQYMYLSFLQQGVESPHFLEAVVFLQNFGVV